MNVKRGRPPVAEKVHRMAVIVPEDDYELLAKICAYTGSRPATMMRDLLNETRPQLIAILSALEAAKGGDSAAAYGILAKSGSKALEELFGEQQRFFDEHVSKK